MAALETPRWDVIAGGCALGGCPWVAWHTSCAWLVCVRNGKVGTSGLKMTENTEYTHETLIEFDDATQEKKIPDVCCIHVV